MSIALKSPPPGKGIVRRVDGGVALRHRARGSDDRHWVAYTLDELRGLPTHLFCPVCETLPFVPPKVREAIWDIVTLADNEGDTP